MRVYCETVREAGGHVPCEPRASAASATEEMIGAEQSLKVKTVCSSKLGDRQQEQAYED